MIVTDLYTQQDVKDCVELYAGLNDHSFLEINIDSAYRHLFQIVRKKKFVKAIRENDQIIAWIYADKVSLPHNVSPFLQQMYYASNQSGIKAARCVVTLHNVLLEEAKAKNYNLVMSPGSHLDPNFVFTRILEKNGWERRGYIALKKLPGDAKEQ